MNAGLARLLRPLLIYPARVLAKRAWGRAWQWEALFVGLALGGVALLTTPPLPGELTFAALTPFLIVWLSAAAVFGSFLHAQIGTFMAEDMGTTEAPITECYHKLDGYWAYKEVLWFIVFLLSGAYPAIAGTVLFMLYPAWRKVYKEERQRVVRS